MTDDRTDATYPPRPPLTARTLVIASIASVVGALVVTRLGYAGKIAGAGLAPIVVLLVTEFGHRSSARLGETAEKVAPVVIHPLRRPSTSGGTEDVPTIVLPPDGERPTTQFEPSVEGPTFVLPDGEGPPRARPARGASTPRLYTVHAGATHPVRSTRARLVGILLAAACGVVISIAAFTLLSTASGGHVKLGSAIQNAGSRHAKAKKPNTASTATTGSTTSKTTSASTPTSAATSTVTSTVTAATTGAGATVAPTGSSATAPTTPSPPSTGPATAATAPATTPGPVATTTTPAATTTPAGASTGTGG